ncbi:unnamed protein product, partial [marine sediment metagenome]
MDCFSCRHVDTGGDRERCLRNGGFVILTKDEVISGCKHIDCTFEEERYPIQIVTLARGAVADQLFALCNDKTIWT